MLLEIENNRYDLQKNGFLRSWSREGLKALYMADATHVTSRAYLEIVINHANKLKNSSWTESSNVLIKVLGTLAVIGTLPITAMTTGQFKDSIVKNYYPWHCLMRCEIRQHDPRISKIFDNQKTGRSLPPLSIYIFRYAHLGPLPDYRYYSALHEFLEPIWDVFYEYIIKPVEPYLMEVGYFILDIAISKMLPYALRSGSFSVRATRVSRIGIKPRFKSQTHGDFLKPANEFSKTRSRVFSQVEDPAFYAKLKSNAKVRLEKVTSIKKSNMVSNCISSFNSIVYSNRLTSTIKIPLEVKLGLIGLALAEKQPLLPDCFQSADILNPKEFKERLKSGNELKIINEDNRRVMRWDVNGRTLASAKIHATKRIGFDIEKIDWEMPEGTHQIIINNKLLKVKDRAGGFTFRIEAQNGKIWRLSWHPSPHIDLPDDANTAKSHFNVNTTDINGNKIESHIFYKTNRGFEFLK